MVKSVRRVAKPRVRSRVAVVRTLSKSASQGVLQLGPLIFRCAIGRTGISARKREGDGATPAGAWQVRRVHYRPDRGPRPPIGSRAVPVKPESGWCDAVSDANYNRPIRHPYPASAEQLWRADHLYDLIIVLGYNDRPRMQGRGSAIFMHVAREGYAPTEGCIALSRTHLLRLLQLQPKLRAVRVVC